MYIRFVDVAIGEADTTYGIRKSRNLGVETRVEIVRRPMQATAQKVVPPIRLVAADASQCSILFRTLVAAIRAYASSRGAVCRALQPGVNSKPVTVQRARSDLIQQSPGSVASPIRSARSDLIQQSPSTPIAQIYPYQSMQGTALWHSPAQSDRHVPFLSAFFCIGIHAWTRNHAGNSQYNH